MGLMSFLTGVSSLFGGGGDKSKSNTSTNQRSETAQTGKSTSTGTITGTVTGTTNQTQTGSQTSKGTSTGNILESTKGTASTTGKEQSTSTERSSMFSSDILASMDSLLKASLGSGAAQQATDALKGRLDQVTALANQPEFDVNQYVSGIASSAMAATQGDLESKINSMLSATGSSEGGNSMSALLGARLRNDAAANLAGIVSNATAQGEQIAQSQRESVTSQISGLSNDIAGQLQNLLGVTKGAQTTSTGTGSTTSQQQQQNQQTSQQQSTNTENVTSTNQSKTNQTSTETSKQNESVNQETTSVTQQNVNQKTNTKTKDGKDLFQNILDALSKSSTAA